MTDTNLQCMRCGSSSDNKSRYCCRCGANLNFQRKISVRKVKIIWRWVLFSLIAIMIFDYIFASAAGQLYLLVKGTEFTALETGVVVSSLGSLTGIFCGTLFSSYMSPGISIKEPMLGAAVEIIISQVILLFIAGAFSALIIVRITIITAIAFCGAKAGEMFQKRNYKSEL